MVRDADNTERYLKLKDRAAEGHAHDLWFLALHVLRVQPTQDKATEAAECISAFDVDKAPEVKLLLSQLHLLAGQREDGLDLLDELIEDNYPPAMCTLANELINGATEYTETTAEGLIKQAQKLGSVRAQMMSATLAHMNAPWFLKIFTYGRWVFWRFQVVRYWATTKEADWEYL
ncbi:MAG: hypothetical protein ABJN14_11695 [Paracoccaceae bacterium]